MQSGLEPLEPCVLLQDCVVSLRREGLTIRMEDAAKGLQARLSLKSEVRRSGVLTAPR